MKIKKAFSIVLSVILAVSCLPMTAYSEEIPDEPEYVDGEILITSAKEIEDNEGLLQTASYDDDTVGINFEDIGITDINEVETYTDEENVYVAEVDGNVEKLCEELNQNGDIIAEPNYILHTCSFTMPREISNNTSFYSTYQKWYIDDILKLPAALEEYQYTGLGVTIAVIDNGFNTEATDFPVNLWENSNGTVGWNVHENSDNIAPIYKSDGTTAFNNTTHGSNVAGIIGMKSNGSGGIGVAYEAELMLIQAAAYSNDSTDPSFTAADIVSAIDFARVNHADVINLSLGTTSNVTTIKNAIDRAYNAGIAVVAAAGNSGVATSSQKYYPASYSNVIGVMAIDKTTPTKLASFSNYDTTGNGTYYNIAAPGVEILGCSNKTGSFSLNNGTSQASPIVAAAMALYIQQNPDASVSQIYSDLLASATDLVTTNSASSYTYKSLNILKLLDYCNPPTITVNLSTNATIDQNYFYGLDEGYQNIGDYITITNGSYVFVPINNQNGTGAKIEIYNENNKLYRTLEVVIFGDINGDAIIDAKDAVILNTSLSGMTTLSDAQSLAADVNIDNLKSSYDSEMIQNYAIGAEYISQIR